MTLPARYHLMYSSNQIEERLRAIAAQIEAWAAAVYIETRRDVIAVPILRGGLFFAADVLRYLESSVEVVPVNVTSYRSDSIGLQLEEPSLNLMELEPAGRSILLLDDICDTGRTLLELSALLGRADAQQIRSAVLIHRQIGEVPFMPDWAAFSHTGPEWFVGYGMDELGRHRNLPDVYVIDQEI